MDRSTVEKKNNGAGDVSEFIVSTFLIVSDVCHTRSELDRVRTINARKD